MTDTGRLLTSEIVKKLYIKGTRLPNADYTDRYDVIGWRFIILLTGERYFFLRIIVNGKRKTAVI